MRQRFGSRYNSVRVLTIFARKSCRQQRSLLETLSSENGHGPLSRVTPRGFSEQTLEGPRFFSLVRGCNSKFSSTVPLPKPSARGLGPSHYLHQSSSVNFAEGLLYQKSSNDEARGEFVNQQSAYLLGCLVSANGTYVLYKMVFTFHASRTTFL